MLILKPLFYSHSPKHRIGYACTQTDAKPSKMIEKSSTQVEEKS